MCIVRGYRINGHFSHSNNYLTSGPRGGMSGWYLGIGGRCEIFGNRPSVFRRRRSARSCYCGRALHHLQPVQSRRVNRLAVIAGLQRKCTCGNAVLHHQYPVTIKAADHGPGGPRAKTPLGNTGLMVEHPPRVRVWTSRPSRASSKSASRRKETEDAPTRSMFPEPVA